MSNLPRLAGWLAAPLLIPVLACSLSAADTEKSPAIEKNAKDGAEMVLIPGGSFRMGSTKAEIDAQFRETGLPEDWKSTPWTNSHSTKKRCSRITSTNMKSQTRNIRRL